MTNSDNATRYLLNQRDEVTLFIERGIAMNDMVRKAANGRLNSIYEALAWLRGESTEELSFGAQIQLDAAHGRR